VGADVVVLGAEVVEDALLATEVGSRGSGGLPLEDEVHVLVLAVLLGASGLDELGEDAELDEPDGEAREAAEGVGGEGGAVVGTDVPGQAEFPEKPGEDGEDADGLHVGAAAAVEDEARVHVLDGERVAELAVAGGKLPFEVCGPGVVGLGGEGVGPTWMPAPDALAALGNEVVAQEDVVDRGARRQGQLGPVLLEVPDDLLGAVVIIGASDVENGLNHVGWSSPGGALGPGRPALKPRRALTLPAPEPLVAGGPADPVALADGAETL